MDDDLNLMVIIFVGMLIVMVIALNVVIPKAPADKELPLILYSDQNMTNTLSNNGVWWNPTISNYTYAYTVYVYNPNSYNCTISVDWKYFPQNASQFFDAYSDINVNQISSRQELIVRLFLTMSPNNITSSNSFGEVFTEISGVKP